MKNYANLIIIVILVALLGYAVVTGKKSEADLKSKNNVPKTTYTRTNKIYSSSFAENSNGSSNKTSTASNKKASAPAPKQPQQPQQPTVSRAVIESVCMEILRAAEAHNDEAVNKKFMQLMEYGVQSYYPPQIINKQTPNCPPIKIEVNGRALSGSMCAIMGYDYQGKMYDVGYCK